MSYCHVKVSWLYLDYLPPWGKFLSFVLLMTGGPNIFIRVSTMTYCMLKGVETIDLECHS